MTTYKLNSTEQTKVAHRIKDMFVVLEEIPVTLDLLSRLLREHNSTISTEEIDAYHATLLQMTATAAELTRNINTKVQRMTATGDQVNKYLVALDDHISNSLDNEQRISNDKVNKREISRV